MVDLVDKLIQKITKAVPGSSIQRGSNMPRVSFIPFGVPSLDLALGGGFALNKFMEMYGDFSTCKTTKAMKGADNWLKMFPQGLVFWMDLEKSWDPVYAMTHISDTSRVIVDQSSTGEDAIDAMYRFVENCHTGLIVVDSVATLTPSTMVSSDTEKANVAGTAHLMGKLIKKVAPGMKHLGEKGSGHTVIFLNQTRVQIGMMYGDPTYAPGGRAREFACSQVVRLTMSKPYMHKQTVNDTKYSHTYAYEIGFKVMKNKVGGKIGESGKVVYYVSAFEDNPPFTYDNARSLYELGVLYGLFSKSGNTYGYSFGGSTYKGQKQIMSLFRDPGVQAEVFRYLVQAKRKREEGVFSQKTKKVLKKRVMI